MSFQTTETIQRLWETFLRDQLAAMPPDQRQKFEGGFEQRFGELLKGAANGEGRDGFLKTLPVVIGHCDGEHGFFHPRILRKKMHKTFVFPGRGFIIPAGKADFRILVLLVCIQDHLISSMGMSHE